MKNYYLSVNTILYCKTWAETLRFYQILFGCPGDPVADWFVEFQINASARISVADEARATIKSAEDKGLTVSMEVDNIDATWDAIHAKGLKPGCVATHSWGAKVFYFFDPEGRRIEIWQQSG